MILDRQRYFAHFISDLISVHRATITKERGRERKPIKVVSFVNCLRSMYLFEDIHFSPFETFEIRISNLQTCYAGGTEHFKRLWYTCESIIYASWFSRLMCNSNECHTKVCACVCKFHTTHRHYFIWLGIILIKWQFQTKSSTTT